MQNLIDIDGLAVRLGGAPVLHDVRLHLAPRQIYGLLGPMGAGKSAIIAVLLGLVPTERGTVRVFGRDPATAVATLRARIGVVPEYSEFYDWMSAEQYLDFFARLRGERAGAAALDEWLSAVGLAPRPGQRIGTFSPAMRQRLAVARALLGAPALLVLDEPTNGLDPRDRREIHELLLRLRAERGLGILICTHLLDDMERLCDRVAILIAGRTEGEGMVSDADLSVGPDARRTWRFGVRLPGAMAA